MNLLLLLILLLLLLIIFVIYLIIFVTFNIKWENITVCHRKCKCICRFTLFIVNWLKVSITDIFKLLLVYLQSFTIIWTGTTITIWWGAATAVSACQRIACVCWSVTTITIWWGATTVISACQRMSATIPTPIFRRGTAVIT